MEFGTVTNEAEEKGMQIEKMWKARRKDTTYSANKSPRKMIWEFSI